MKKLLCLVLCLMLSIPAAMADTADTLPKLFMRQLSGGNGNGARGYISITASGVAEWLNLLMPFTAADIQLRAIGEKQGDASASVADDDDWQVKLYVKDSQGNEKGISWLYGDPAGVYFQSELLPDASLMLPVENVQLLYQLFRGEFAELFFAFDPMELTTLRSNGNTPAYQAVADVMSIPAAEWEEKWLPVLEKYFLQLDLWMAGFSEASSYGSEGGSLKMSTAYTIPADELKAEAKYIIGQMLYDSDLQNLLIPLVTMEQRITYLNPQMLYFYEACIDALELEGDVVLTREMSALGDVVSTTVELPLPKLPVALTKDADHAIQALLELPDGDLLAGMNRVSLKQAGKERAITLSGEGKAVTIVAEAAETAEGERSMAGTISISSENAADTGAYSAAFSCSYSHRIWQDEKYLDHDTTAFKLQLEPDMVSVENGCQPVGIDVSVDYRNNPNKQTSPAQVNINVAAQLPDANVAVEAVLRISTQMSMTELTNTGMQDVSAMSPEEKEALLNTFVIGATDVMNALYETQEAAEEAASAPAEAEPTAVPPVNE